MLNDSADEWSKNIIKEQLGEVKYYTGDGYKLINKELRAGIEPDKDIKILDESIKKGIIPTDTKAMDILCQLE